MNILILSIGAKYKLVNIFKENNFYVVTTDCSDLSAGLYASDKYYIVPRMSDSTYIPTLLEICEKDKIDVLLPLQEEELVLISNHAEEFTKKDIFIPSSNASTIELCKDKYLLYKTLINNNINAIPTYDLLKDAEAIDNLSYPLFIKPRFGAGSVGTLKTNTSKLLEAYAADVNESLVVQPYYEAEEYGVDAYVDCNSGVLSSVFIKKKLRMRAGETEKSVSVHNQDILQLVKSVVEAIPFRGPIDLDIFKFENTYYILEINPRFGGGYPHAHSCGINFPQFIKNNVNGFANEVVLNSYESDIIGLKYTEIYIDNKE